MSQQNHPMTDEQLKQEAIKEARKLISAERAREIEKLIRWKNFGCLTIRERPPIDDITEAERKAINCVWSTLPGDCSFMSAVYILAK